ncbi:MAG TPA: DUF4190 domain-containing protein [Thermoanaerobaculia bacterium]|nr:DUF4190 domain-containing protein [Thermoanaerobaculia bacterium]
MTTAEPGAPPQPGPSTQAITALIVGILSIVTCCGVILSPIAWYLGSQELKAIRQGHSPAAGESIARVAWILGLVGTILLLFGILWTFFWGGMAVLSSFLNR